KTRLTTEVGEGTTALITGTIRDHAGLGFKPDTLTLTLYEQLSGTILNNRDQESILDANGGTVSSAGALAAKRSPAHNALLSQTRSHEDHVALLRWTYNGGADAGWAEVVFRIHNQLKIS